MTVEAKTFHEVMPGQGGIRVPLHRFWDPQGRWGYLIENCRHGNSGLHVIYNFVLFPDAFKGRDTGGTGLNDMASLMERNHEDNLRWQTEKTGREHYKCWSELKGQYEGETLVIASCGPSLSETLPLLYKRRKEFRLLCLNRSIRAFNDPEAKPDFYYFVERRGMSDWIYDVHPQTGVPQKMFDLSGIKMIGTPQCDHRIIRQFEPELCYWGYTELGKMAHNAEINRLEKFDIKCGTTIGNAPYIAWKLGFKKIIFVGCDFSLDCEIAFDKQEPQNKQKAITHPTKMYFDKMWNQTHYASDPGWVTRALPVIGINSRSVMTEPMLSGHRSYMEAVLDILHYDAKVECINASPRGLMKFNCMSLDEALDKPVGVLE